MRSVIAAGNENTGGWAAAVSVNIHRPSWLSWRRFKQDTRHVVLHHIGMSHS